MPSAERPPDLFAALHVAFETWLAGTAPTDARGRPLVPPPAPPAGAEVADFASFCRRYLAACPVVSAGQVGDDFGVVLADGRAFPLASGMTPTVAGGAFGAVGCNAVAQFDPLPPAHDVPVTGRAG